MTTTKRFIPLAAAACLAPVLVIGQHTAASAAEATYSKDIEVGADWVTANSYKFGEYTGFNEDGPFAIGNIDVRRLSAWDNPQDTQYWSTVGTNLGLDSRSARIDYGQQGRFKVFLNYNEIPHYRIDSARTPITGGGGVLTLPSNWVGGTTTAGMTNLRADLRELDLKTDRQRIGGGASWHIAKGWDVKGTYRHEFKSGTDSVAGIFGTSGGNPRATFLPYAIDQNTDELGLTLDYTGQRLQAELSYHGSLYRNDIDSVIWKNPFNDPGAWDDSAGFAQSGQGQLGTPPDNQAHQVSLSAGYTVSPTTRVNAQFSYGRMLQNDDYLAYTINPTLAASITSPLPRSSLDGDITTMHGNLVVASRPLPKLNLRGRYTYDDRDDNSPRDVYVVIRNDSETQAAADSDRARVNRPYGRIQHKLSLDGGYQILPRTKASVGYDFEYLQRNFQEVEKTREHTGRVKVRTAPVSYASGWIEYARSMRNGSAYTSNRPFLDGFAPAHVLGEAVADRYENDPLLRKPYMADRDRDKVTASVTLLPSEMVTVGLTGSHTRDAYQNTDIGLKDQRMDNISLDASMNPRDNVTLNAYVTYDQAEYTQRGYERTGGTFPPGATRDPGSFWSVVTHDRGYTAGTGVAWKQVIDKLDIAADYAFSHQVTSFDIDGGSSLTFAPLPDLTTTVHSFSVRGEYRLKDKIAVRVGYRFEWFSTDDFANDGVNVDTLNNVITLGNTSPHYVAHVIGASVLVGF